MSWKQRGAISVVLSEVASDSPASLVFLLEERTYGSRRVRVKLIDNPVTSCVSADEEFDELCFEFGLELDEIVSKLEKHGSGSTDVNPRHRERCV